MQNAFPHSGFMEQLQRARVQDECRLRPKEHCVHWGDAMPGERTVPQAGSLGRSPAGLVDPRSPSPPVCCDACTNIPMSFQSNGVELYSKSHCWKERTRLLKLSLHTEGKANSPGPVWPLLGWGAWPMRQP